MQQRNRTLYLLLIVLFILTLLLSSGCAQNRNMETEEDEGDANTNEPAENEEGAVTEEKLAQMTEDQAPNGCKDCHKKINEEKDYRLSTEVNNIEGHPQVEEDVTVADCKGCHGEEGENSLGNLMHVGHLIEGEHYKEKYNSNCINCHKIEENGIIVVKNLEEDEQ